MIAAHERPKLSEAQFQAQVVRYAELLGWRCHHQYDSRRSREGWPDLICIRRPRLLALELKSERGRLTSAQREVLEDLRACGIPAYVVRPSQWRRLEELFR